MEAIIREMDHPQTIIIVKFAGITQTKPARWIASSIDYRVEAPHSSASDRTFPDNHDGRIQAVERLIKKIQTKGMEAASLKPEEHPVITYVGHREEIGYIYGVHKVFA